MSLLGNITQAVLGGRTAKKAAGAQMDAEREALALQREMFETQRADFAPYMQAGTGALGGLQALTSPEGRAQALSDYYNSDEFRAMQDIANTNAARAGAVTGGLRSGSTYQALESVAPQLGQSFLTNMYNQLICWLLFIVTGKKRYHTILVDEPPEYIKDQAIYIIGVRNYIWCAMMKCPCGCNELIHLNLLPEGLPRWSHNLHKNWSISLHPSIWRTKGCKSHFFLRKGSVKWCLTSEKN